jgi:hypothetical protein
MRRGNGVVGADEWRNLEVMVLLCLVDKTEIVSEEGGFIAKMWE